MTGRRPLSRPVSRRRALAAALALFALGVHALLPPGFMPGRAGGPGLSLCAGGLAPHLAAALLAEAMDAHGGDAAAGAPDAAGGHCVFAASAAIPPDHAAPPAPPAPAQGAFAAGAYSSRPIPPAGPPLGARAPPVSRA